MKRPAKLMTAVTQGHGSITAICVFLRLARARLCSVLPRGVSLLDGDEGEQALAVLLLSRNHFTSWFGDMRYFELILGVPHVNVGDGVPSMYLRRLYLDQKLPQMLGNFIYGWEKLPAAIRWDGLREHGRGLDALTERHRYVAEHVSGEWLVDAAFEPAAAQTDHRSFDTGLAQMWSVLAQPIVSQARRRLNARAAVDRGGPFLRSTLTYDTSAAVTRPVTGRVRFGPGFDPAAFAQLEVEAPALGADGLGAVAWHGRQVVSLPVPVRP